MLTPHLSKESARHLHRESWDVRPHLPAHGRRRSDDGCEFDEVLTLMKLGASVVLEYMYSYVREGGSPPATFDYMVRNLLRRRNVYW